MVMWSGSERSRGADWTTFSVGLDRPGRRAENPPKKSGYLRVGAAYGARSQEDGTPDAESRSALRDSHWSGLSAFADTAVPGTPPVAR